MKTNPSLSSEHRTRNRNRLRCRVLAAVDLVWKLGEFALSILATFIPAILHGLNLTSPPVSVNGDGAGGGPEELLTNNGNSNTHVNQGGGKFLVLLGGGIPDKTEAHYEIMDTRVYNFLLNPVLTFFYFIAFFLSVMISFFLYYETSSGKSTSRQNEIAACTIWSRIAVISLIILLLRFFLPYALITFTNISYTLSRILFKVGGIVIVLVHARELKSSLSGDEEDGLHNNGEDDEDELKRRRSETSSGERRSRFQSTSSADFVEIELPLKQPTPIPVVHNNSNDRKAKTGDMERVKIHIVQVEVYVEKEMFDQALAELKIAQECLRYNSHLSIMETTIQKMMNLSNSFNLGGGPIGAFDEATSKDYYGILGVPKNSTGEIIKSAYRRKSLRHHPDKHITESESVQKIEGIRYMKVREAYEMLSDPAKRQNYDETVRLNKEKMEKLHKRLKTMLETFNTSLSFPIIVS